MEINVSGHTYHWEELERWATCMSSHFMRASEYARISGLNEIDRLRFIIGALVQHNHSLISELVRFAEQSPVPPIIIQKNEIKNDKPSAL